MKANPLVCKGAFVCVPTGEESCRKWAAPTWKDTGASRAAVDLLACDPQCGGGMSLLVGV